MRRIINAKFVLKDTDHLLRKFHMEAGGQMQSVIDEKFIEACKPYTPWRTGSLWNRAESTTVKGSGKIIFPGPYAHYLYHGEIYGPNIPVFDDDSGEPTRFFSPKNRKKYPTGRPIRFSPDKNPNAQAHWAEVAKANHMNEILEEARKAAKR